MTAKAYHDQSSGFYRAVCRDDACRADNAQRNYWRTPHMKQAGAEKAARAHNAEKHGASA